MHHASFAALTTGLLGRTVFAAESADSEPSADRFIAGKDQRLIVHSAKVGEIETPLELLREHSITPQPLLFVRNNQTLPNSLTLEAAEVGDWQIDIGGLADGPRVIRVVELQKLAQQEVEMVLQCSGNSRSRFESSVKAEGVPWQHGAMGNVVFRGVPLRMALDYFRIRPQRMARFLAAEGRDAPAMLGAADFEHSLPLDDALNKSMLALSLNGEPLPRVHGGPVRLITPGYYATMNVKWLSALRFEAAESNNHHHVGRYRTPLQPIAPGTPFKSTLENSEPNWRMRIKSVIFAPLARESVKPGPLEVRGVAWNAGQTRIDAVEISLDGGQSWRRTELTKPASAYAWHHWKATVMVAAGPQTILSRAIDALGRSQPLDGSIHWNPAGYAWSGVDSVTFNVG